MQMTPVVCVCILDLQRACCKAAFNTDRGRKSTMQKKKIKKNTNCLWAKQSRVVMRLVVSVVFN